MRTSSSTSRSFSASEEQQSDGNSSSNSRADNGSMGEVPGVGNVGDVMISSPFFADVASMIRAAGGCVIMIVCLDCVHRHKYHEQQTPQAPVLGRSVAAGPIKIRRLSGTVHFG